MELEDLSGVILLGHSYGGMLPKTYMYCSSPATGSSDQFAAKSGAIPRGGPVANTNR
jgi:hypothetical protein